MKSKRCSMQKRQVESKTSEAISKFEIEQMDGVSEKNLNFT